MFAQLNANLIGQASDSGGNCYVITQDQLNQVGGVWYNNPIDFAADFTIYYQGNFGTKDANGADGMALVFKRNFQPELGNSGGGLSYEGISPSLVVEFDTWQNVDLADPVADHIAIMRNGIPNHNSSGNNLAGPVQASISNANIEDGQNHEIKLEWVAATQTLSVYFDCTFRTQLNLDVKSIIFSGDDSVFFGFVGSTGGSSNLHQVCLNRVSFVDDLQLQDEVICEAQSLQIDATIASGVTYSWSPTVGISNPNIANPIFSPTNTTTYTVTIADVCGDFVVEDVTVNVLQVEIPIFDAVAPICSGDQLQALPLTSNNGITGTWSPALNNTNTTTYTFTPTSNPCAPTVTLEIIVNPIRVPTFQPIDPICSGDTLPPLPITSINGIDGTWSPAINNTSTTVYTFTPNSDEECAVSSTLEIIVNAIETPQFDIQTTICEGEQLNFPTTSLNGIEGIWSPPFDATASGSYTFTPLPDECASAVILQVQVNPLEVPVFNLATSICEGDTTFEFPTQSDNGISGTWSPELDIMNTTLYTFTPLEDECAVSITKQLVIIPEVVPIFNYPIISICPGDALPALPQLSSNGISGTWSPDLNNSETTTYTFAPDNTQNCAVETTLEIIVTEPIIPSFDTINPICIGDNLQNLPLISNNGIIGSWSPALNNSTTTTYTFTPNAGQCAVSSTLEIEVLPISELTIAVFVISEAFSDNQSVRVDVFGGTGNYEFKLDHGSWQMEAVFSGINGCDEHVVSVRETSTCSNVASETFRVLDYPKFFSPNGDNKNETWNIECLKNQPNARITIFSRYGTLLAVIKPSQVGWDGTYNNQQMPSNDYWFKVDYFGNSNTVRTFTSHFTLKR